MYVLGPHGAAVQVGHPLNNRQADSIARAGARSRRTEEPVEHIREILGRDTRPLVLRLHLRAVDDNRDGRAVR